MTDLRVNIQVDLEEPGPNQHWEYTSEVAVPPDYHDVDVEPFVRHQVERAVVAWEKEAFGECRAIDIIHQYEVRARVIANLIKFAPHDLSRKALGDAIMKVLDEANVPLITTYSRQDMED